MRMLLRDTLLRTLLCQDVAVRYPAADPAGEDVAARYVGSCCTIRCCGRCCVRDACCGRCCVRMLLRDTLLRTLRYENVAARYAAADAAVWGCCCGILRPHTVTSSVRSTVSHSTILTQRHPHTAASAAAAPYRGLNAVINKGSKIWTP